MDEVRRRARLAAQLQWLAEHYRELDVRSGSRANLPMAKHATALDALAAKILCGGRMAPLDSSMAA